MKVNKLVKGKQYRYTCMFPITVTYLYETINGYIFEGFGVKRILSISTVDLYIEEL